MNSNKSVKKTIGMITICITMLSSCLTQTNVGTGGVTLGSQVCTKYMTLGTSDNSGGTAYSIQCSFNETDKKMTCTQTKETNIVYTWVYNTIGDFVEEHRLFGNLLRFFPGKWLTYARTDSATPANTRTYTNTFDANSMLTTSTDDGVAATDKITYTFTSWDANKRPISGVLDDDATCDETGNTYAKLIFGYASTSATSLVSGNGCVATKTTFNFDSNINITSIVTEVEGTTASTDAAATEAITINTTAETCYEVTQ